MPLLLLGILHASFYFLTPSGGWSMSTKRKKYSAKYILLLCNTLVNFTTDVCAVLMLYYQEEEEMMDRNSVLPLLYTIFATAGLLGCVMRAKVKIRGVYLMMRQEGSEVEMLRLEMLDEVACVMQAVFADLPTLV